MRIFFKQHALSLMGDAEIFDEFNRIIYSVKGQLSWTSELRLYDARMHLVGTVKRSARSFSPQFDIFLGNSYVGSITKEMTFGHPPIYHISYNGWVIKSANFEREYFFFDSDGNSFAHAIKDFNSMGDSYMMDIANDVDGDGVPDADPISVIMFIIAVDAEKASRAATV